MIPSGYKASKVYSVLPTDGAGDLTFSRAGALPSFNATRVNSEGLIEEVLSNVPRLDYLDGGCPSLLIEPESRNLLTYSEDFSDASWVKNRLNVSVNSTLAPNGTLSADLLDTNLDGSGSSVTKNISTTAGLRYNISVFAKKNNVDFLMFNIVNNSFTNGVRVWFNLETKSISATTNIGIGLNVSNTLVEEYGNDWLRLSLSVVADDTLLRNVFVVTNSSGVFSSLIGDKVYLWGAQLEALPYATSYIPTVASTVTRVAETASKTGLSSLINSSEGVLFVEMAALANDLTTRVISLSNGTFSNRLYIAFNTSSNQFTAVSQNPSSTNVIIFTVSDIKAFNKVAFKYKENDFALYINGLLVGTDTSGTTFTVGTLNRLGFDSGAGGSPLYAKVKNLQVYTTALSDAELIALTQ
jgi:hypothetical protein